MAIKKMTRKNSHKKINIICFLLTILITMAFTSGMASAKEAPEYWIKVNAQENVVNVYEKVKDDWKIKRTMVCSCGAEGSETTLGDFTVQKKWRWQKLFGSAYGQYATQFNGNYLFHSVPYTTNGDGSSCIRSAYEMLGENASQGCVRMQVIDVKWIYDNCPEGTKVTVYEDNDIGPIGKPEPVPMSGEGDTGWDPTDPDAGEDWKADIDVNISVKTFMELEYGSEFNPETLVNAKSVFTQEDVPVDVTLKKVTYNEGGQKPVIDVPQKFIDTNAPGEYLVEYTYKTRYGKNSTSVSKNAKIVVRENAAGKEGKQ